MHVCMYQQSKIKKALTNIKSAIILNIVISSLVYLIVACKSVELSG